MGFSDCRGTSSTGVGGRGGAMGSAVKENASGGEREREKPYSYFFYIATCASIDLRSSFGEGGLGGGGGGLYCLSTTSNTSWTALTSYSSDISE